MKRPLALLGFSAFGALALAACLRQDILPALAVSCGAVGFCAILAAAVAKRKLPGWKALGAFSFAGVVLLTAALSLARYAPAAAKPAALADQLDGVKAHLRGTVLDYPEEMYHKAYYLIRAERVEVNGRTLDVPEFTLRLSASQPLSCRPYDTIECTAGLYAFDSQGGLYSTRNSRWADGISMGGYLASFDGLSIVPITSWPPGRFFAELRHKAGRCFESALPREEAGLLRAMLLGEETQVPQSVINDFRTTGSSHLLVISGLHLTTLIGFFSMLFGKLPLGRRGRDLLLISLVAGYLFLTGFPVSAVRSGAMLILYLMGDMAGLRTDGVNSLGGAVLLICLWNPFSGGDLGFALSVFSTLGILLFAGKLSRSMVRRLPGLRLRRALFPVAASLSVTFSATLLTLPFQLAVFGGVSLISPIANLLLTLPCSLLLYTGFSGGALALLPPSSGLAQPFLFCAGWLSRAAIGLADWLAKAPWAFLSLNDSRSMLALLLFLILVVTVWVLSRNRNGACVVLAAAVLLAGCKEAWESTVEKGVVTLAAAADSSCVAVLQGDSAVVLSLGGYRTGAASQLIRGSNIRRVEALCLPVRDKDAREAAAELLDSWNTETLVLPPGAYLGRDLELAGKRAKRLYLGDGETFRALDGVEITAEYDMARLKLSVNSVSIVVETGPTGEGSCQILFTTQMDTRINSPFTVLQNDDILEESGGVGNLPPGRWVIPAGDGFFVDVLPDGTVRVRGETDA